jgi:hypothetical protein
MDRMWKHLFDSDRARRDDIEDARERVDMLQTSFDAASDQVVGISQAIGELRAGVERLSLAIEGLVRVLEVRGVLTRDEIALMIQRLDLADGVEDGRIGPDVTARAPSCPRCGRPVNARRKTCVFCDAPVVVPRQAKTPEAARALRTAVCSSCGRRVPEVDTYFTERGVVCDSCHDK